MRQNGFGVEVSRDLPRQGAGSFNGVDDNGRHRRTRTMWTASAHIIAAVIGSGILSLPWAMAQLGWIAAPAVIFMFAFVTYYTSALLADCHPDQGERNGNYMAAVSSHLGRLTGTLCGLVLLLNLFGVAIEASGSMTAISRSNCFHKKGEESPCGTSSNPYIIAFVIIEIILSQIPDFDQLWWHPIMAAVMSFTYSTIELALSIAKVAENGKFGGSLTGISIGTVTPTQKIWWSFQALGEIAFAYSYSSILFEIQAIRSLPSESKTMKKATLISVAVTTLFYMLCGCMGYAAFGDMAPKNFLMGFGFFKPYWLIDLANAAIVIHLIGAYQIYSRPISTFIEEHAMRRFATSQIITREIQIPLPCFPTYKLSVFRLIWRTIFVILTTVISMLLSSFNEVIGLVGALGFWSLTVYFPIELYIAQMRVPKWSPKWLCLQILSVACLIVSIAAVVGSIAGFVLHLTNYKTFDTSY